MTEKRGYGVFFPFAIVMGIFMTIGMSLVLVIEELNTVVIGPCISIETTSTTEKTSCGEYDKTYPGGLIEGKKYYLQLKGTDFGFFDREVTGATLSTIDMKG